MKHRRTITILLTLLWSAATGGGLAMLHAYGGSAAAMDDVAQLWPDHTSLGHPPNERTLLLFVHPRCPCTAASVDELGELLAGLDESQRPELRVVIRMPDDASDPEWAVPRLRDELARLPGATLIDDPSGSIARAFGATASGAVLCYDTNARCVFRGGITASRAHRGPSPGRSQLTDILNDQRTSGSAPVFGCALFEPDGCNDQTCTDLGESQ